MVALKALTLLLLLQSHPSPVTTDLSLPLDAQGFQLWGLTQGFSHSLFLFSLSMLTYPASFSMLANPDGFIHPCHLRLIGKGVIHTNMCPFSRVTYASYRLLAIPRVLLNSKQYGRPMKQYLEGLVSLGVLHITTYLEPQFLFFIPTQK